MNTVNPVTDLVVARSFQRASEILQDAFDYGDGSHSRKRIAIAMNLLAIARAENGLKHIWNNGMLNEEGKHNIIKGLKNTPTADADEAVHDIWNDMDDEHKQAHLENHPESKFHVIEQHNRDAQDQHHETEVAEDTQREEEHQNLRDRDDRNKKNKRVRGKKKGKEDEKDDDWWNNMSMQEQRKYLRDHPGSKKARRWRVAARNLAMGATKKIHHEVRKMGHDYKNGMAGLRALKNGRKMTDEQKEGLKKTAKRVAVLLIAALAATAMFTPLGPMAMDVGDKYFEGLEKRGPELAVEHEASTTVGQTDQAANNPNGGETTVGQTDSNTSQSGVNLHGVLRKDKREAHKQDETELEWMRRDMTEWLLKTDTHELEKEIKANKR